MASSPLSQWLGGPYQIVLKEPAGEQVTGILRNLVPQQHLTLEKGDDTHFRHFIRPMRLAQLRLCDFELTLQHRQLPLFVLANSSRSWTSVSQTSRTSQN